MPVEHFIAPACVIDCSARQAADADFLLTVGHLKAWEKRHGRIPADAWVLMRTDWSKRTDPVAYQNLDDTGQHTPGPDPDCVRFLVQERDVLGFGTETIGTDAGQAAHFTPPYPCHYYMHGAGKYGLQCLCNLDRLPATGALIVAAPLKILKGSGSPVARVRACAETLLARHCSRRQPTSNIAATADGVVNQARHRAKWRGRARKRDGRAL